MNLKLLSQEIDFAASAADKRSTIPILANLLLDQNDGVMTLTGTDLEVSAVTAFHADEGKILTTVPTRRLKQVISGMNGAESCKIEADKHFMATLSAGNFSARIPGMSHESFPQLPSLPAAMQDVPLASLVSAIRATSHAISEEESRFTLNGSLLMIDAKGQFLSVATDGHRLALASFGNLENHSMRFMIPTRLTQLMPKLGDAGACQVGTDDAHAFFVARFKERAHRLLLGRKLTGDFPDYERAIPKKSPIKVLVNREALLKACKRMLPLTDERSHAAGLKFDNATVAGAQITVTARLIEAGDALDVVREGCHMAIGTDLEAGFNLEYVCDALGAMVSETVEIGLKDAISPMTIKGEAGEGVALTEVVMPLRIL